MIAPIVATTMDHRLNPDTPAPPNRLTTNPPTKAPTMPRRMVTIIPPGSSPGIISLAKAPAMSPTTIQAMMPIRTPFFPGLPQETSYAKIIVLEVRRDGSFLGKALYEGSLYGE